jgi:uncharacterized Zn-binding protein involved in type VI secretion
MPAIAVQKVSLTNIAPPGGPPGNVLTGLPTVYAMGSPVAFVGSPITPHGDPDKSPLCKSGPFISAGVEAAGRVYVSGVLVATVGSICNCGHVIASGIPNINIGPA